MSKGVYKITNLINNKIYVGSSNDLNYRKSMHFSKLKHNNHINKHLQNSFNKYGRENFIFEIIEECEECEEYENIKELLLNKEQYYIDTLTPQYNILVIAGSSLGYNHSEETKIKISNSTKGKEKSKEHRESMKGCQIGKIVSEETKQKLKDYAKVRPTPSRQVKVIVNDIIYNTLKEATIANNLTRGQMQYRIKSDTFPNYSYYK